MIRYYTPRAGAKVRIISDLHYGHFKCEAPPPAELIDSFSGVDVLIVAGDLAETRPNAWQERGIALRDELRTCCKKAGIELIEIAGNHDPSTDCQMLSLWDNSTIVIHGHQLFDEVAPWGWEYLDDIAACKEFIAQFPERENDIMQRLHLAQKLSERVRPKLHRKKKFGIKFIDHALHCFWPPMRPINILLAWATVASRAEHFAKQFSPQCKTIVFGHCHRMGSWRKGQRQLFTTGAWFKHAKPAYVDMIDGRITSYNKCK